MSASEAPLQVQEVSVRLGGVPIVTHADFTLRDGELALLTGPNGAGKSTLLRAIVNLLPTSTGDVFIKGHRPATPAARARFMYVPDEAALYEDLTLSEHMQFVSLLYGQADAAGRMRTQLELFGLLDREGEYPATHSRGMRQKLSLSLALGLETPLLVLDEPYNGLDVDAQLLLSQALQARAAAGGAVLLTGHQNELLENLGARQLKLQDGQLLT